MSIQGLKRLEEVPCDACGSRKRKILYHYDLQDEQADIVRCQNCDFVYLCPRPKLDYLVHFYGSEYYSYNLSTAENVDRRALKDRLRRTVMKHHFEYYDIDKADTLQVPRAISWSFRNFVAVPRYHQNGRLLDVGCGAGQKLLEFRSLGWEVRGLELSAAAAAAGQKHGLEILTTTLSEAPWPTEFFSAITFYHSLEHFSSPHLVLRAAFRLLAPGGEILIVVPNFDCVERKLFGKDWGWMQVPLHFCHFTKATLSKILSESGFTVETVGFSPAGQSAELQVFNRFPLTKRLSVPALNLFGVACAAAGSGKALIVSARKRTGH